MVAQDKGLQIWNNVLSTAMNMPGIKVDRKTFLETECRSFCTSDQLQEVVKKGPTGVLDIQVINDLANACINNHTAKVTALSTAAGIPGGLAMFGTVPADIAQYYFHVFKLSQKLAYLYGFPDLCDEDGKLTENAQNMLTVFVGVMLGAAAANKVLTDISKRLGMEVAKRLPQKALTKTVYYPIIKNIAKWIGVNMTKSSFGKIAGKAIPILGGIISGGLTLATFRPGAKRLQKQMIKQKDYLCAGYFTEQTDSAYAEYEDLSDDEPSAQTVSIEELSLQAMINMAKIDKAVTEVEGAYLNAKIEQSSLDEDTLLILAKAVDTDKTFDVDFSLFAGHDVECIKLIQSMVEIAKLEGNFSLPEKLYLKKAAKAIGLTEDDLAEYMD